MKILAFALSMIAAPLAAQDVMTDWSADRTLVFDAADVDLDDALWTARAIVVFGESPNDPQFLRQMDLLEAGLHDLVERDVLIIVDTDPDARTDIRLRLRPRSFMLALIGKDGQLKFRKPLPWNVREIARSIDKMPLRQQEVRDRRLDNQGGEEIPLI